MTGIYAFSIRSIPVYMNPGFFLLLGFYVLMSADSGWLHALLVAGCIAASLLVHEFGHALLASWYRLRPMIVLHAWGGLCLHQPARNDRHSALVVAAGPAAGLLFGLGCAVLWGLLAGAVPELLSTRPYLNTMLVLLAGINLFWTLANSVPLWPLDGGQLLRLLLRRVLPAPQAARTTHLISVGTAAVLLVLSLLWGQPFLVLIVALLGWQNIQQLRDTAPETPPAVRNPWFEELLANAEAHLLEGNPREAARLGHQARAEPGISTEDHLRVWEVIAFSTLKTGQLQQGLRFAKRAPPTIRLVRAQVRALVRLGERDQAHQLLASPLGAALPESIRIELAQLLGKSPAEVSG